MSLSFDDSPAMISTAEGLTPTSLAIKRRHASLALPSTGGALMRSLIAPLCSPANWSRAARGCTRIRNVTAPAFSVISTTFSCLTDSGDGVGNEAGQQLHYKHRHDGREVEHAEDQKAPQ